MVAGREPFATWYYPLAWYSTLTLLEAAVALRDGRFFLLRRPSSLASALGWSIPFWLLFELLDLRLQNWFYVFLPRDPAARWTGIALSFATVIPAVLGAERALRAWGVARDARWPALAIGKNVIRGCQLVGTLMLLLPLVWPRVFYPFVWGALLLLVDPWVRARDPARSLLADLERGDPGRILRLLAGGAGIGLLWELYNLGARGKWIYTVPGLETLKLFEMPLLGFIGFPFFALEAFAAWQALVVAGLAVPPEATARRLPPRALWAAGLGGLCFTFLAIAAMQGRTIASLAPSLSALDVPEPVVRAAGVEDPWALAAANPLRLARGAGVEEPDAREWIDRARLATLRGIGAENATRFRDAGAGSVEALGRADPERLAERLRAAGASMPTARIRIWVEAAREATRDDPVSPRTS